MNLEKQTQIRAFEDKIRIKITALEGLQISLKKRKKGKCQNCDYIINKFIEHLIKLKYMLVWDLFQPHKHKNKINQLIKIFIKEEKRKIKICDKRECSVFRILKKMLMDISSQYPK